MTSLWQSLLRNAHETFVAPWIGHASIWDSALGRHHLETRPEEHGWYSFHVVGPRNARPLAQVPPDYEKLTSGGYKGYLVGNYLVADGLTEFDPNPGKLTSNAVEPVYLVEPGLPRFSRVSVRLSYSDFLVYVGPEMPLGPEDEVARAFEDRLSSVDAIKGISPGLDAAFRLETFHRAEVERHRAELDRLRHEEAERLEREAERAEIVRRLGDGAGRRAMAKLDFAEAAKAALAVGGAAYLDHRPSYQRGEIVVRFRLDHRRFECVCDETLHVIDSGICLQDHTTGERGDRMFTLESLPGVIAQAIREHKLVVYRHAD